MIWIYFLLLLLFLGVIIMLLIKLYYDNIEILWVKNIIRVIVGECLVNMV